MACCSGLPEVPKQTLFLGCSVASFSCSLQWDAGQSDVSIVLREDQCSGLKYWYTTSLDITSGVTPDLGFFGEDRYQRTDGTQYSSCIKENGSDTLIRSAIDLIGIPVFFRMYTGPGNGWEFTGILQDWTRSDSPNDAPEYRIKLVDPRLILEGVQLIIGDYTGSVSGIVTIGDGGTGYPQTNLFNVYGFLEQFGLICPSYSQCTPGIYAASATCPNAVDGPQFGSLVGGFGGSLINENGIPYNHIIWGFNYLANTVPSLSNAFSPYGRVAFHATSVPSNLDASGCGLIAQDSFGGIYANKNFYFVDLRELPLFPSTAYRYGGTSMSLLDIINQASEDLNFNYYFELLPIKDPGNTFSNTDVAKVIKLRTTLRQVQPNLDKICEFIEGSNCVLSSSVGQELRNETVSKFLIGGNKQTIYQVQQGFNPDGGSTSQITSLDSALGGVRTDAGCNEIDDVILPYFGTDYNGDLIVPCISGDVYWGDIYYFRAPLWTVQSELQTLHFSGLTHVVITEIELISALSSYTSWESYIYAAHTDTWRAMPSGAVPEKDMAAIQELTEGRARLPQDVSNPKISKIRDNTTSLGNRQIEDMQAIYNWVRSYATDYYGKKFAVRVPFTCVVLDTDSYQPIVNESPTNDGGWTEMLNVMGLTNNGPLTLNSDDPLNFFRNDEQKITPFVRIDNAVGLDVANLPKDSYLLVWQITNGTPATGNGPPSGTPAGSICYQDVLSGLIWVYYFDEWFPLNNVCMLGGLGAPGAELLGALTKNEFCPAYKDLDTNTVYIAGDSTYTGLTTVTVNDWDIEATAYLYIKVNVQEEYVYHDKSNYFAPRVIVELPESVPIAEKFAAHVRGIEESLRALKRRGANALTDNQITDIANQLKVRVAAESGWTGAGRFRALLAAAAIPLKHHSLTYGPWFNPTVVGRVEIVNDPNLVPWRYNGMAAMNTAANLLCNESRVFMRKGELGSITLASVPEIPLGAELTAVNAGYYGAGMHLVENRTGNLMLQSGYDYNGSPVNEDHLGINFLSSWNGSYGPNVTDINVQVDAQSFSTTYNMRTFSPRRGFFERFNANRIQQFSTNLSQISKLIREEDAAQKRFNQVLNSRGTGGGDSHYDEQRKPTTTAPVIVGEIVKNSDPRSAIAVMPLITCQNELTSGFATKAFSSWDVLLRPVSLDGDGNLPRMVRYAGTTGVLQDDLIPMTNPAGKARSHVATERSIPGASSGIGHDFEILGRSGGDVKGLMHKQISGIEKYTDDYRFMAFRGPLIVTGWGFDTEGYPVPNEADDPLAAASGQFTTANRTDKFLSGHLQKPDTWVTAPVDLRLDRDRGVWVAGSGSAPPPAQNNNRDTLFPVKILAERNECCVWRGFYREVTLYGPTGLCAPTWDDVDVWVYHPCNFLESGNCVLARPIEGSGTFSGICNPDNYPVYRFMTLAEGPNGKTPCDCCCPANGPGSYIDIAFEEPYCFSGSGYRLFWTTGLLNENWYRDCSGEVPGDFAGSGVFALPVNEFIEYTANYPVILVGFDGDVSGVPEGLWAETDYNTWEFKRWWIQHPSLSEVIEPLHTDPDAIYGVTGQTTIAAANTLTTSFIHTEPLRLRYKMIMQCPDNQDLGIENPFMMHFTPATYPHSGIIGDWFGFSELDCYFNTNYITNGGLDKGNGSSCGIVVDIPDTAFSYDFYPFQAHYFGMCKCTGIDDLPLTRFQTLGVTFLTGATEPLDTCRISSLGGIKIKVQW